MEHELWIVEAGKEAYEWRVIAGCPWPDERGDIGKKQVEANARLIAAAPELLEGLQRFAARFGNISGVGNGGLGRDVEAARAAIKKALGQ